MLNPTELTKILESAGFWVETFEKVFRLHELLEDVFSHPFPVLFP